MKHRINIDRTEVVEWAKLIAQLVCVAAVGALVVAFVAHVAWFATAPRRTAEGFIADKRYSPAWIETIHGRMKKTCVGDICTWHSEPDRTVHHPERWNIRIKEHGCTLTVWVGVTRERFDAVKIGDEETFETPYQRCK